MRNSYTAVDDPNVAPRNINDCKRSRGSRTPTREVTVTGGVVSAAQVRSQCGSDSICVIPDGVTLRMDDNLNVGAMKIRGKLEWNAETQGNQSTLYLCGGYIVVEKDGSFDMQLENHNRQGWIYIKDNGASHSGLKTRAFGADASREGNNDYERNHNPTISISGYPLSRTWTPLIWVGKLETDYLGIASTEDKSSGWGQAFIITSINGDGTITLNEAASHDFLAEFEGKALKSAEVVNLSRNIVITGDDHTHVPCQHGLPEAVLGEGTSVEGCKCNPWRSRCTVGLHTGQFHGGVSRVQNVRVEKCGQRGIEGKYCLHFHLAHKCPDCLYKNNAIETSQQRGIIIHGTHLSTVEGNVLYNVRGAGIYVEDGNEMWNTISYNAVICPIPFRHHHKNYAGGGCTVPGTSNRLSDTSDNQAAFYFHGAATNNMIGNRGAGAFDGMFLKAGGRGRGHTTNHVCESAARLGRFQGNTFHGCGRFGTYALGDNYPKETDQSPDRDGFNEDWGLCRGFDANGDANGLGGTFMDHTDYGNAFVGHYMAGDLQHSGHHSTDSNNLIYWKETKNFKNGCSAHLINGYYAKGNIALPDQATFIIENSVFGDSVELEACHHCNVGSDGFLCQPQYILHKVRWLGNGRGGRKVWFQHHDTQGHGANQLHGGVFTLSPPDAETVMAGGQIQDSFFPDGYVSLVSNKYDCLLNVPNNVCNRSEGRTYGEGILCKVPLRALKIYSRGLLPGARTLRVEIWFNDRGIAGQGGRADITTEIPFHHVGDTHRGPRSRQGYSLPIIPGRDKSYRISWAGGNFPTDWVIEFSDPVMGNRWGEEFMYLSVAGRNCADNGLVSSQHDRKFIYSGEEFMADQAWGRHGACVGNGPQPGNTPIQRCDDGVPIEATSCPEMCSSDCVSGNAYCDCGTGTCQCEAGFGGENCEVDLCADANCGEHGTCSAKYLGGLLPVTAAGKACICDEGWFGQQCDQGPGGQSNSIRPQTPDSGPQTPANLRPRTPRARCGCSSCTDTIWNRDAEGYSCGARVEWLQSNQHNSELQACRKVGEEQSVCGSCNPDTCGNDTPAAGGTEATSAPAGGGADAQEEEEEDSFRRRWWHGFFGSQGGDPPATAAPQEEVRSPALPPPRCGCTSCTDRVWQTDAQGHSCGNRIEWLQAHGHPQEEDACRVVGGEQLACRGCNPDMCDEEDDGGAGTTPSVQNVGNNGHPRSAYPLKVCQGDCDHDRECSPGLRCFQRSGGDDVPGCLGGATDMTDVDYCIPRGAGGRNLRNREEN